MAKRRSRMSHRVKGSVLDDCTSDCSQTLFLLELHASLRRTTSRTPREHNVVMLLLHATLSNPHWLSDRTQYILNVVERTLLVRTANTNYTRPVHDVIRGVHVT